MELWKPYKTGIYSVSNKGRVINNESKRILKGTVMTNGYRMFNLRGENDRQLGHRLVANLFIPNKDSKEQVNHINGDKLDNNVNNLEWCTAMENMHHSFELGLQPNEMRDIYCFTPDGRFVEKYISAMDVERKTGFSQSTILRACSSRHLSYGLWWTYSKDFDRKKIIKAVNKNNNKEYEFYTQKECSNVLGLSPATVSMGVNNKREHSTYKFFKIKI